MTIDVNEARELVKRCIEILNDDKAVEKRDIDTLHDIINKMCEHIERLENEVSKKE